LNHQLEDLQIDFLCMEAGQEVEKKENRKRGGKGKVKVRYRRKGKIRK